MNRFPDTIFLTSPSIPESAVCYPQTAMRFSTRCVAAWGHAGKGNFSHRFGKKIPSYLRSESCMTETVFDGLSQF
jgi:hypothetical protein